MSDLPSDHFRITVEKTESPSYADLQSAYDKVSGMRGDDGHVLELHESLREIVPTTGDKVVCLKVFNRKITNEKAIKWAKSHGYRPAFPAEREAFAKTNPDQTWIVDLGSFSVEKNSRGVPVLQGFDSRRDFSLCWGVGEWGPGWRFLFVRK